MTTYALFGDSHAQVVFPLLKEKIERAGDIVLFSKPQPGWTTLKHLQNGLEQLVKEYQPDVLLLSLGGNNSNLSATYQDIIHEIERIAKEAGVKKVVWVSPASAVQQDVQQRHEWTSNWLKSYLPTKFTFIDVRPVTMRGHRSDGVHFERTTYKEWAQYVYDSLPKPPAISLIPKWTWWTAASLITVSLLVWAIRREK